MAKITEKVIKVIHESGRTVIRVVKWGRGAPLLVKQEKYEDGEGELRYGKVKGFNIGDLDILQNNMSQIKEALGE